MFFSKLVTKNSMECLIEDILKNNISSYQDLLKILHLDLPPSVDLKNNQDNAEQLIPQFSYFTSNLANIYPFIFTRKLNCEIFNNFNN